MCWDGLCNCGETYSSCPGDCGCAQGANIAPQATPSISSGSSDQVLYGPQKMNDGLLQANCGFCWIYTETSLGGSAYVQYNWSTPRTLWGLWFDTEPSGGSGCAYTGGRTLAGGDVQWWNGSAWITATTITGRTNDWSYQFAGPITTTAVRLYRAYSYPTANAVIFEWQVYACN
jgi:hypothetical protein